MSDPPMICSSCGRDIPADTEVAAGDEEERRQFLAAETQACTRLTDAQEELDLMRETGDSPGAASPVLQAWDQLSEVQGRVTRLEEEIAELQSEMHHTPEDRE